MRFGCSWSTCRALTFKLFISRLNKEAWRIRRTESITLSFVVMGNGAVELGTACQQEVKVNRYNKRHPEFKREDRYFFIFDNREDIMNAPYLLKSPTLFCTIKYNKQWVPELRFVNPDVWRKRNEGGSST